MQYLVVIEKAGRNYSAYVPDLPGCAATAKTAAGARAAIRKAVDFHLDGLREDGLPFPKPTAKSARVVVTSKRTRRSAA
jgi:predicted RNase H-like HicB family nuclease